MKKPMQKSIETGQPAFRAYAEYVIEAMPDVTLPLLRLMYRHNASVREYRAHKERIEARARQLAVEHAHGAISAHLGLTIQPTTQPSSCGLCDKSLSADSRPTHWQIQPQYLDQSN